MQLLVLAGIVFAVAAVVFALQNNVAVTVTFLVWRFDSTLAMVLLLALAAGAIIIALVSAPAGIRSRWTISRQRRRVAELDRQILELQARLAALEGPARSAQPASGALPEGHPAQRAGPL